MKYIGVNMNIKWSKAIYIVAVSLSYLLAYSLIGFLFGYVGGYLGQMLSVYHTAEARQVVFWSLLIFGVLAGLHGFVRNAYRMVKNKNF